MRAIPILDEHLRDATTTKFAYTAILNLIVARLHGHDYKKAEKYIKLARKQDRVSVNYEYRLELQYLEVLLNYLETRDPDYYLKIMNYIHTLENIGEGIIATNKKRELKLLTDPLDSTNRSIRTFPVVLTKEN